MFSRIHCIYTYQAFIENFFVEAHLGTVLDMRYELHTSHEVCSASTVAYVKLYNI